MGWLRTPAVVLGLLGALHRLLVGAQMVMLLEREEGKPSERTMGDVDALVDGRAVAGATASRTTAPRQ